MIAEFLDLLSMDNRKPSRWQGHTKPEPEYEHFAISLKNFKRTKARREMARASRRRNRK